MSFKENWTEGFNQEFEKMGVVTGTYNLTRFPNIPGKMFRLKAFSGNGGSIFLGNIRSTGSFPRLPWQMAAGGDTDWFTADNLNDYFMAGSSGASYLSYWIKG